MSGYRDCKSCIFCMAGLSNGNCLAFCAGAENGASAKCGLGFASDPTSSSSGNSKCISGGEKSFGLADEEIGAIGILCAGCRSAGSAALAANAPLTLAESRVTSCESTAAANLASRFLPGCIEIEVGPDLDLIRHTAIAANAIAASAKIHAIKDQELSGREAGFSSPFTALVGDADLGNVDSGVDTWLAAFRTAATVVDPLMTRSATLTREARPASSFSNCKIRFSRASSTEVRSSISSVNCRARRLSRSASVVAGLDEKSPPADSLKRGPPDV